MGRPLAGLFIVLILLWMTTLGVLYHAVATGGFPFFGCCRLPPVTEGR